MMEDVYSNTILPIIMSGFLLATLNLYTIVMEDDTYKNLNYFKNIF